ncbi:MAG: PadR family transcriptional regulator [Desulfurococcaceae archaeon]
MDSPRALIRLKKKLTVENLWLYVICVLKSRGAPLKAYDIKVALRDLFRIDPPAVTVYTVLYRMVRDGLLRREHRGEEVFYSLTEGGINAYREGLVFIEEVLAKLKLHG